MKFLEMIVTMVLAITLSYIVGKYDYFPTMSRNCKGGPLPKIFTIHGLWPSNKSGYIGNCSGDNFNISVMTSDLVARLNDSWPSLKRSKENLDFWKYQYNRHGKCSNDLFSQTKYFEHAWHLWNKYKAHDLFSNHSILPDSPHNYSKLEKAIRSFINWRKPLLRCKRNATNQYLLEVRICFDKKANKPENCKGDTDCTQTLDVWYMLQPIDARVN
ncbi:unnamed protein product [Prunus armeniaca]|uniref:Uncharacterized protein n=1 Tax=Prunus armeniaca TaxID=36596 RepID=A0A6J5VU95_PRUAR|nr:unnamed protein product [Prunus armeniaca]